MSRKNFINSKAINEEEKVFHIFATLHHEIQTDAGIVFVVVMVRVREMRFV
jgi:hypothetical protein